MRFGADREDVTLDLRLPVMCGVPSSHEAGHEESLVVHVSYREGIGYIDACFLGGADADDTIDKDCCDNGMFSAGYRIHGNRWTIGQPPKNFYLRPYALCCIDAGNGTRWV